MTMTRGMDVVGKANLVPTLGRYAGPIWLEAGMN
jgi:hypothetical protein